MYIYFLFLNSLHIFFIYTLRPISICNNTDIKNLKLFINDVKLQSFIKYACY